MDFQELFPSYTKAFGRFLVGDTPKSNGKLDAARPPRTVRGSPTHEDWQNHLNGAGEGLGLIPLLDDNKNVQWGAIDVDVYNLDHASLERDIENLPLVLTKSKSGGGHLWVFLSEPVPATLVVNKLNEWASAIGYGGVEIFPKQTGRRIREGEEDIGNWINLPYFGNTRHCVYQGVDVELDVFLQLAERNRITRKDLELINILSPEAAIFKDGPPCLEMITATGGVMEGGRNNFLFGVGVYFKHKFKDWPDKLTQFNSEHCSPPLSQTEVHTIIQSLDHKSYNYHCNKVPLSSHCNRTLCVRRDYGVAYGSAGELNVTLSGLTKITTNPPRWLINIDGVRVELENTNDLTEQGRFKRFAVESVNKLPTVVSKNKWDNTVQGLLNMVEVIEAPDDASPQGQFLAYVQRFVETHGQDESKDAILLGRVWLENGDACFRSSDLMSYLKRERFVDLRVAAMYSLLHKLGVKKGCFKIKGKSVPYWRVPVEGLNGIQTEEFEAPDFKNPFGDK